MPEEVDEVQEGSSESTDQPVAPQALSNPLVLTRASGAKCNRLFPLRLAASIKRDSEHFAIVSMSPEIQGQSSEYHLKLEIAEHEIGYFTMELFGTHVGAKGGRRYVQLKDTTIVAPRPALLLQGCRATAVPELLGAQLADAVFATKTHQAELLEGRPCMHCVTMLVRASASESAEICLLLSAEQATILKNSLFC